MVLGLRRDHAKELLGISGFDRHEVDALEAVLVSPALRGPDDDDMVWFRYQIKAAGAPWTLGSYQGLSSTRLWTDFRLLSAAGSRHARRLTGAWAAESPKSCREYLGAKLDILATLPPVQTIEAHRQVVPGSDFAGYSGTGLIPGLGRLQDPDAASPSNRQRFDSINRFLKAVLDEPEAELRIPHHRGTINVQLGRRSAPSS